MERILAYRSRTMVYVGTVRSPIRDSGGGGHGGAPQPEYGTPIRESLCRRQIYLKLLQGRLPDVSP